MNLDPFLLLDAAIRFLLPVGVATLFATAAAMALLVGVFALLTRRARRRYTAAEEEGHGLDFFTWRDAD
ncbi:hypothetical protein ACFWU3_00155 [Streptomyces sp. NPDC058685]|uniref:hypothetical protein n=1 Tax=Streptomyces sp. NPDC058685 TaxID=3346598 RepID=UPI003658EB18